ncbi:COX15/CtaA family protein [Wenyingzhuangia sp.]|jgi:heme a synthase|uniref:COX15/CtaA family protein n=1 Tax=Wenyingzhuangia sp. TaxID=1964193 RepID=UPI00321BEF2C
MKLSLSRTLNIAVVSVYLIFLAGSVVRMTGSGMGCPDWPKCFGYYIPPTSENQITWKPDTPFKKGYVIIHDEALFVANKSLVTSSSFEPSNWTAYTKHEYAKFNVYHTYTEYVNRLASVLSGLVFLILLWKVTFATEKKKGVAPLVYIAFLGMLFEAWLGKIVVDSFLTPYVITFHMIGGLLIVSLLLRAKFLCSETILKSNYNKDFHRLLVVSLIMMIGQILLGTQVRQYVDDQVKLFGFEHKEFRLLNPTFKFYFHRSFTIAIIVVNAFLFWVNRKYNLGFKGIKYVMFLLGFEAVSGILMYYVNFPFGTQAVHLLTGAVLFGVLLYMIFKSNAIKRESN